MDLTTALGDSAAISRARVVVQNYVCFVYLGESCFRDLRKALPSGAGKACCAYLTDNPVRAFRNAVAHANWRYRSDFGTIEFWARKGASLDEPMAKWEVSQNDLFLAGTSPLHGVRGIPVHLAVKHAIALVGGRGNILANRGRGARPPQVNRRR